MIFLKKKITEEKNVEMVAATNQTLRPVGAQSGKEMSGILLHPHFTEKTAAGTKHHKYTFIVVKDTNKIKVAQAVENRYNVIVENVHIINIPKKQRMHGQQIGFKPGMKKAIVTIAENQTIEIQ